MSKRNIGLEILEGIKEIIAYNDGKENLKKRELNESASPQTMQKKVELCQSTQENDA
ncbi:MAG: hypothetical protein AB1656_17060 [Candidatus Omnitrophota bacterium]